MDTQLFQLLSLVLLLAAVALLALTVSSLGKLRKALESRPAVAPQPAEESAPEAAPAAVDLSPSPEPQPGGAGEPEPEPAGVEPRGALGEPVGQGGAVEAERREEPAATDTFAAASAQAAEPAAEPMDQPFERDGRWWFRRGDELLVYDEQTGQWMPAPDTGSPQPAGVAAAPSQEAPGAQEASGGFWKCPSCGAVNGSTATSCRMCFAARP